MSVIKVKELLESIEISKYKDIRLFVKCHSKRTVEI